ncbi:signal peptidase I [Sporosarcina sp. SAFN-015]|uniref:signal peptidase I n=1 Tax=Sporosarcina sp. SAFN-015 TaxID=3387274 RepID=UPI003F81521C
MHMIKLDVAPTTQKEKDTNKVIESIVSWVKFVLIVAAIVFIVRSVVGITVISGNSMASSINNNDVIVTSNLFYELERNDIILFRDQHGFDVIKRIIAVPDDTVEIVGGAVLVNGEAVNEEFAMGTPNDMALTSVLKDSYFVMGDNRTPGESLDSRSSDVGLIPKERVKGEVFISLYPFKNFMNQ